ncbi:MAG TPA: type II secretion system F family protein [Candidatus Limnocylindrales bacterium]|nr:type II secretion system F family protein [Candidatus Limnocylindrales bacterium]
MSSYCYIAVDPGGGETRGKLDVADQHEAIRRIKEMGLFPTKVSRHSAAKPFFAGLRDHRRSGNKSLDLFGFRPKLKPAQLAIFTRQLATLIDAGMPLLRGLRVLAEQAEQAALTRILNDLARDIESGSSLAEAVSQHPRTFNALYINMVKAGEVGGALEITLTRLAEFMEKAQKIRGKITAAMFYPCAVMTVATAIVAVLMTYVVPRFKQVFDGLMNGAQLPAFTRFVFELSTALTHRLPLLALAAVALITLLAFGLNTSAGRWSFDRLKLAMPILGPLFRKAAISRFARTLGTLVSNGVPILQALTIVKDTAGNVIVGRIIANVHENVKQGDPIAPTLKASGIFPAMVAGMVDVGEQTGALPEMLMKIADNYDDEVDNAASALTSLLEPIMIVLLAIVVGSIVIAMFLPLVIIVGAGPPTSHGLDD